MDSNRPEKPLNKAEKLRQNNIDVAKNKKILYDYRERSQS
jgi:hypothetical protein